MSTENEVVLFHWNIVEISGHHSIFVGMRVKAGIKSPYVFRYSTAIKSFDEASGIGTTESGRVYRCQGPPSDPKGEIRALVKQMLPIRSYRFRYEFTATQG